MSRELTSKSRLFFYKMHFHPINGFFLIVQNIFYDHVHSSYSNCLLKFSEDTQPS